jgi:hypothetical protein
MKSYDSDRSEVLYNILIHFGVPMKLHEWGRIGIHIGYWWKARRKETTGKTKT